MNDKPLKQTISKIIKRLEMLNSHDIKKPELKTGFTRIDECFKKGDLIILAGVCKIGKTSFAVDIARNLALKENKNVGYISIGESEESIIMKLLISESKIFGWKVRTGILDKDELARIKKVGNIIENVNIYIKDPIAPSLIDIKNTSEKLFKKNHLDFLIIDHLQLIYNGNNRGPQQNTEIIEKIKSLAEVFNIPILLLVQINGDTLSFPLKTTMRNIGNLEKSANSILVINRTVCGEELKSEILIEKNDRGYTGKMEIIFDPNKETFDCKD